MTYTELDLAQVERRILAAERCLARQKEVLKRHIDAELPTDIPLQQLAEFEVTLFDLNRRRKYIRDEIAATNTQQLMELFWAFPARQSAGGDHPTTTPHAPAQNTQRSNSYAAS